MADPANSNLAGTVIRLPRSDRRARDPELGKRLDNYARIIWMAFWAAVFLPFVAPFLDGFGWSWPKVAQAFEQMLEVGIAFYGALTPWYQLVLLVMIGLFVLLRRMAWMQLPKSARPSTWRALLTVRLLLFAVSATGLVISVQKLAFFTDAVVQNPFIEPPADNRPFRDTLLAELARATAGMNFDQVIQDSLSRGDIDHARAHVQAARLLGVTLQPATQQAYDAATTWSTTLMRGSWDALRGAVTGQSDSVAGLAGALAVDLTPVGDLRDIAIQLGVNDKPDELILGLSVFGLALTALAYIAPQEAVPVRTGKAALKSASRFARVSTGVGSDIRRIATEAVDLPSFRRAVRNGEVTPDMAARFVRKEGVREIGQVSGELYEIGNLASTGTALAVLKHADTLADLPFYKRVAVAFGEGAESVVTILGKNTKRAFRVYRAGSHLAVRIHAFTAGLIASITGLLLSLSGSLSTFLYKRFLKWAVTF